MLFARNDEELAFAILGCCGVFALATLITSIFFHITMMKALQACSFRNQVMAPGLVWLNYVPVLNLVWPFMTVIQIGGSFRREFRDRGVESSDESYGTGVGITSLVMFFIAVGVNVFGRFALEAARAREMAIIIGLFVLVLLLVAFILWIVYWGKIAGFTRELNALGRREDHDDENDRPRRRDHERDDRDDRRPYDDDDDRRRDRDDHDDHDRERR